MVLQYMYIGKYKEILFPVNVMIEMFRIPETLCCKCGTVLLLRCVDLKTDERGNSTNTRFYTTQRKTQAGILVVLYWLGGYYSWNYSVHCTIKCGHTHTVYMCTYMYTVHNILYHDTNCTSNCQFCLGNLIMINQIIVMYNAVVQVTFECTCT